MQCRQRHIRVRHCRKYGCRSWNCGAISHRSKLFPLPVLLAVIFNFGSQPTLGNVAHCPQCHVKVGLGRNHIVCIKITIVEAPPTARPRRWNRLRAHYNTPYASASSGRCVVDCWCQWNGAFRLIILNAIELIAEPKIMDVTSRCPRHSTRSNLKPDAWAVGLHFIRFL